MPSQTKILRLVLPGDIIEEIDVGKVKQKIFLGPGLRWHEQVVKTTRAGHLKRDGKNLYYVDTMQKRYIPQKREFVIGIVIKKKGDNFLMDIGSHEPASISFLAFENASKKTRTELKLGDLVYGQLLQANKDMEPEMVCIDVYNRAVGMGILPEGGLLFNIPLHVARSIIDPENPFLIKIAEKIAYSAVVGFNGRIYVKASNDIEMIAVMHAISMLEVMKLEEALESVVDLLASFLGCKKNL